MKVTTTAPDEVRTPTVQPELWQPGESRDLPDEIGRALIQSSHFVGEDTPAMAAAPPPPEEQQLQPVPQAPTQPQDQAAPPAGPPSL